MTGDSTSLLDLISPDRERPQRKEPSRWIAFSVFPFVRFIPEAFATRLPYSIVMKFLALSVAALISSATAFAPTFRGSPASTTASTTSLAARKPFISGNWKLNPQTKSEAVDLASNIAAAITSDSPDADVALFVPYVFIEAAQEATGGKLAIGAEVRSRGSRVLVGNAYVVWFVRCSFRNTHCPFFLVVFRRVFARKSKEPSPEPSRPACSSPLACNGPWLVIRSVG